MTTQTIKVNFETLNTLASQLRAAGATIKVAKGNDHIFNISIIKQPTLVSIEEILTCLEPSEINNSISAQGLGLGSESIAVQPEKTEDFAVAENIASTLRETIGSSDTVEVALEEGTNTTAKNSRKKSTKSKQKVEDLPCFADNDDIPF